MKKVLTLVLAIVMIAAMFVPSTLAAEYDMTGMKVGVSWYSYASTSAIRNLDYLVYRLKEKGCEVYYASADSSVEKHISDIESFIERDVDMVLLNPTQQDGFQNVFAKLQEAGIPVILLGNALDKEVYVPGEDYVFYMRNDHLQQGQAAAQLAKKVADEELDGGKAYTLVLFGTPGMSSSTNRCKGYSDEVATYDNVITLSIQTARNKASEAQSIVENYLMSSGGPETEGGLNTIICMTHNCAIGAMAGVANMGYKLNEEVFVIEVDGVKESLKSIMDGEMYAAVESPAFYADDALVLIENWLSGEEMEDEYVLPFKIFTAENAEEWYNNFAKYDELIGLKVD